MKIMITIQHPAHVHFFKHAITEFTRRDHDVFVFARENEITSDLLTNYGIDHEMLVGASNSTPSLAAVQAIYETRLFRHARRIRPDVITAVGGVAAAHVSRLVGARSIVFYDTEHATLIKKLAYPFAHVICTPACYRDELGAKQIRYPGYHELAYVHPNRFEPDPEVLAELGLVADESLVICRFSSWDASHDIGQGGFADVEDVVTHLDAAGAHVLISSATDLPSSIESYVSTIPPHRIHDLLYFADIVVSEGATTAAEAALLGTPAVYVNTQTMGYTDELEARYGLLFNFNDADRHESSLERAITLLETGDPRIWRQRRERLLAETVDVTDVIVQVVEHTVQPEPLMPNSTRVPARS